MVWAATTGAATRATQGAAKGAVLWAAKGAAKEVETGADETTANGVYMAPHGAGIGTSRIHWLPRAPQRSLLQAATGNLIPVALVLKYRNIHIDYIQYTFRLGKPFLNKTLLCSNFKFLSKKLHDNKHKICNNTHKK